MDRRGFLRASLALLLAGPGASEAQRSSKPPRIGFLGLPSESGLRNQLDAFRGGPRELGYVEGKNILLEYRWADGHYERLSDLAGELVRLPVDVLVTHGTPGGFAAKHATATIPIVIATSADAVASGLVTSLARSGGNLTGLTFFVPELNAKRLEIFKEVLPHAGRMAVLVNSGNPAMGPIMQAMERRPGRSRWGLPSFGFSECAQTGGLVGYGINIVGLFRRAASFVARILKGAAPADLPVERPTNFDLVINLKTAKALGVRMPPSLLARA